MQKFEESLEGAYQSSGKKNIQQSQNKGKSKITINVSETQYPVVKQVAKKLKWNLINQQINNLNFDICWVDGCVKQQFFAKMQQHQKINHYPGMAILSRKNNLGKNLMAFRHKFPDQYDFFPITWSLPNDWQELQAYHECRQQGKAQTFIVKPQASCQGRGIFLTRNLQKIKNDRCVVQRYMHKPFLIDGLKFDLRIYVLVNGLDPLRIFVFQQGLARFATQPYRPPRTDNLDNRFMHLTNYAVNKDNPNFIFNQSDQHMDVGHKRSLTSIYKKLQQQGYNVVQLKQKINEIFIKTIITGYPTLSTSYMSCHGQNFANDMCFQVLGFDIILDHKLDPYLLQINYTPSFTTDTPLDHLIKRNLIHHTLNLMNVTDRWKKDVKGKRDKEIQERMLTGKRKKFTNEERKIYMIEEAKKRDEYEKENMGGFTKIFLLSEEQMNEYRKFYDYAVELFNSTNQLSSITTFTTPLNPFPLYKHYFDDMNTTKTHTSSQFLKNKKAILLKQKNGKNSLSKIQTIRTQKGTRQLLVGGSQGKRINSAKPKNTKKQNIQLAQKSSIKQLSIKNQKQSRDLDSQVAMQNASIFRNKKLIQGVNLKKRKSQSHLADSECLDA